LCNPNRCAARKVRDRGRHPKGDRMSGKALIRILWGLLAATAIAAPGAVAEERPPPAPHPAGHLLLTGSSTMAPLVGDIVKRFQTLHPGVQVQVAAGGSGRGISDTRAGKNDIGMVSRPLTEQEGDLYGVPIARDGISVVVHRDNPVRHLSRQQVTAIFTGTIGNWKRVGGRDAPIAVINPKAGYSSAELFTHYFGVDYAAIKATRLAGDNPARIAAIVDDPGGISYVSVGEGERRIQAGTPIKLLPVDGVAASSKTIRSGDFPISRPLTLVTRGRPTGLARTFIEFALSSQVTDLILANDFVPYLD